MDLGAESAALVDSLLHFYDLICRARTAERTGGRHIIDMPDGLLSSFLGTEWAALAPIPLCRLLAVGPGGEGSFLKEDKILTQINMKRTQVRDFT